MNEPPATEETSSRRAIPWVAKVGALASLIESYVAPTASSVAMLEVRAGSHQISIGSSGLRWGFAIILFLLLLACARPCAAACFPIREAEPEKSRTAGSTRPESRQQASSRLTDANGMLGEITSPRTPRPEFRHQASSRIHDLNDMLGEITSPRGDPPQRSSVGFTMTKVRSMLRGAPIEEEGEGQVEQRMKREMILTVSAIVRLGKQLRKTVLKYPRSGRIFFGASRAQARYIRVQELSLDKNSGDPEKDLYSWRQGRLAWWESEDAHQRKEEPKGVVKLSNIHDLKHGDDKTRVELEYWDGNVKSMLELGFVNSSEATTWRTDLLMLLTKLHEDLGDVSISRGLQALQQG